MKVVLVQLNPKYKKPIENIERIRQKLKDQLKGHSVDLVIFPEMSFTGYSFKNQKDVEPFLERLPFDGPSLQFTKELALEYGCLVAVGFPEESQNYEYFNSMVLMSSKGILKHYQKTFLFQVDHNWAKEGPGFLSTPLVINDEQFQLGIGICMDLNPKEFKAPFEDFEFANFHLRNQTNLLILMMNWLEQGVEESEEEAIQNRIRYWLTRLLPLTDQHVTVLICNRVGREQEAKFCGASCILEFSDKHRPRLLACLSRDNEEILLQELNIANQNKVQTA